MLPDLAPIGVRQPDAVGVRDHDEQRSGALTHRGCLGLNRTVRQLADVEVAAVAFRDLADRFTIGRHRLRDRERALRVLVAATVVGTREHDAETDAEAHRDDGQLQQKNLRP